MERSNSIWRVITISTLFFVSGGCATNSIFNPYPNQALAFQEAVISIDGIDRKTVDTILSDLNKHRSDADAMLYMMERGRIAQLDSRFNVSRSDFEQVIVGFEEQDLAATIDVSELVSQSGSLLTNDNAIPYKGAGYERVFAHHHQAFNYLGEHDLEGASVEFRKAALEQRVLLEKYEQEVTEAYQDAAENNIDIDVLSRQFAGLNAVAGRVKNSFQNAYTFYASAAFWEATGELNSALVDYKKAYEINSNNNYIRQDIARITKKMGDQTGQMDLNEPEDNEGVVVVFFEEGFVPAKSEIKIPIPTFDGGIISLAFPYYYTDQWPVSSPLRAMDEQFNELGISEIVADVYVLAVKDLTEQIPQLLVRQVLRAFTKYKFQDNFEKRSSDLGRLIANIYNIISESADLRSWLTLPNTAQIMRFNLAEGTREINFSTPESRTRLSLDIKAKRTTFVRAVHANNHLIIQVYPL